MGFSPGILSTPTLKRMIKVELFSGALKHSFPRINAGAPTKKNAPPVLPARGRTRLGRHQRHLQSELREKAINAIVNVVVRDLEKEGIFRRRAFRDSHPVAARQAYRGLLLCYLV